MKKETRSLVQTVAIVLSILFIVLAMVNSHFDWQLLAIPGSAFALLSIFISCLLLWLFVGIDWPSVLCLVLLGLGWLPKVTYSQVFSLSFGNSTFVFLLFTFIVTYALEQTPALKRLVGWFLKTNFAKKSPSHFLGSFLGAVLVISCFISPTILFMIVFPIYEEMMEVFGLEKGSRQASFALITLFSTIAIGTAMTPINHVFAITAMGLYHTATGVSISNIQYMGIAMPAGICIFVGMLASLHRLWKLDLSEVTFQSLESLENLPKVTKKETWIVSIFSIVIALWIIPEWLGILSPSVAAFLKSAGMAFPPMIGAVLLACIREDGKPLISIQEALTRGVYWPSLLLVGATLSLGTLLTKPELGVLPLIESGLTPLFHQWSAMMIVIVFVIWAGLQTNFSSNLVTVSVVTTVLTTIAASTDLGIHTAVVACLIGFMASLAYMTPPAMPYVAISVGSGWTSSFIWWMVISVKYCKCSSDWVSIRNFMDVRKGKMMLEEQRQKIDSIDCQIVALFEERTNVVEEVAKIKLDNDIPILDSGREEQVILKVQSYLKDESLKDELAELYTELMRISREHQKNWIEKQG